MINHVTITKNSICLSQMLIIMGVCSRNGAARRAMRCKELAYATSDDDIPLSVSEADFVTTEGCIDNTKIHLRALSAAPRGN